MFVRHADEGYCSARPRHRSGRHAPRRLPRLRALERALRETRADAAWVGWGFVAEHPEFAELCERLGIVFVGPSADAMRLLGDKIARQAARRGGRRPGRALERRPGRHASTRPRAHAERDRLPADDQGRRRRRRARHPPRRRARTSSTGAFERARAEAAQAFGDPTRAAWSALLGAGPPRRGPGDRRRRRAAPGRSACATAAYQRRHQKVIEESASTGSDRASRSASSARPRRAPGAGGRLPRRRHGRVPLRARRAALLLHGGQRPPAGRAPGDRDGRPGSTWSSCSSTSPPAGASRATRRRRAGHAIEARLNAEDPGARLRAGARAGSRCCGLPTGPGVRVDTGVAEGDAIPPEFDSMIAKLIALGTRPRRGARAPAPRPRATRRSLIDGGTTNQGFLLELLEPPRGARRPVDTAWLDRLAGRRRRSSRRATPTSRSLQAAIDALRRARPPPTARASTRCARRGRPQADAEVGRVVDLALPRPAYRFAVLPDRRPDRYRVDGRRRRRVEVERRAAEPPRAAPRAPAAAPTGR